MVFIGYTLDNFFFFFFNLDGKLELLENQIYKFILWFFGYR